VVVPNLFVERLITVARAGLLRDATRAFAAEPALPLASIVAIAHQCFNTEYVHDESPAETAALAVLSDAIAARRGAGQTVPPHVYAIYACYRPLHTLDDSASIAAELSPTALSSLAVRQIREPQEELRLRATITALTEVAGSVSTAVRDQYEENPYPRWLRIERDVAQTSVAAFLRNQFPHASLAGLSEAPPRILIAGCGTGRHPIGTARRFPDSSVLAIDLSLASLAYAKRKTQELGIGNIEYQQADLLAMGGHPETFAVIDSTGVLHHLEDPVAGWSFWLTAAARRRHARRPLQRAGATPRRPRARADCRRRIRPARPRVSVHAAPPSSSVAPTRLLARVARGEDFYSLSGCRDLLFHVQEQRFTLPRIAAILAELDLRFVGFEWADTDAPARYRDRFPDDPATVQSRELARARAGPARHVCADVPVLGAEARLNKR
jgi:SAM-dependent methyltransferase